jgi:hypothetical protein
MRHTTWLVLTGALLASGCNRPPPAPPLRPVADVKQLMKFILEPAADEYWDAVGTIEDAKGVVHVAPATDEEWAAVVNSAYVVTEGGNLLMMTGRAKDSGDWIKLSQALIEVGQRAIKAAESKNTQAVFDTGAELYEACVACHAKYMPPQAGPNTGK